MEKEEENIHEYCDEEKKQLEKENEDLREQIDQLEDIIGEIRHLVK